MASKLPQEEYPPLEKGFIYETMFPIWEFNNTRYTRPSTKENVVKYQNNLKELKIIKNTYGAKQFNNAWDMYQRQIKEDKPSLFSRAKKALGFKKGGSVGYTQRWANARKKNG